MISTHLKTYFKYRRNITHKKDCAKYSYANLELDFKQQDVNDINNVDTRHINCYDVHAQTILYIENLNYSIYGIISMKSEYHITHTILHCCYTWLSSVHFPCGRYYINKYIKNISLCLKWSNIQFNNHYHHGRQPPLF